MPKNKKGFSIILTDSDSVKARMYIIHAMGAASATLNLLGVVGSPTMVRLASEVWMSKEGTKGGGKNKKPLIKPSEDPNRFEALMVTGMDSNRDNIIETRAIKRTMVKNKENIELEEMNDEMRSRDGKIESSVLSSILSEFWNSYNEMHERLIKDGSYKKFKKEVEEDPKRVFQFAIEIALQGAQMRQQLDEV